MQGRVADAVFTDPPYNVPIAGHVSGKGRIQHREFAMGAGEMSPEQYRLFLETSFQFLWANSRSGSLHYVCMDWRHIEAVIAIGEEYFELKNICVWVKDNAGMGSLYRSQHELVAVFKKPGDVHRNNVQLGRFGRNRSNVWQYPGANSFSRNGDEGNLLALHPTVKPVQLVADALLDCTMRDDLVLDPYLGSGSVLLAAERVGRTCFGIELDPLYVDAAIRRWQRHTGQEAVLEASRSGLLELKADDVR
jgi:DNA modification methylase